MSRNPKECPNCGKYRTERVHVEWYINEVEEVRTCNECPTQYTLNYANPVLAQEETHE